MIRRGLDLLYSTATAGVPVALIAILCLIVAQMVCLWLGPVFLRSAQYAGHAMAAASRMALADMFWRTVHVRVIKGIRTYRPLRRSSEIRVSAMTVVLALFFAGYAIQAPLSSHNIHDISQGQDRAPLGILKIAMVAGAPILSAAMLGTVGRRSPCAKPRPSALRFPAIAPIPMGAGFLTLAMGFTGAPEALAQITALEGGILLLQGWTQYGPGYIACTRHPICAIMIAILASLALLPEHGTSRPTLRKGEP
ncbi:hypothetical protein [Thioclava sp. GXIMD2076]|uniref:hypothetical protein n=1 Tax=Thioclava sp. GXIMD2076 TaxID=3131931 RepID=UPI0030D1295E